MMNCPKCNEDILSMSVHYCPAKEKADDRLALTACSPVGVEARVAAERPNPAMKTAPHRSDYCSITSLSSLAAMPCWASLNPPQRLALRAYLKAVEKSEKMARKAADDFGMGRRRSTTNAANWSTYAGQRDRLEKALIESGVSLTHVIEIEAEWRELTKIRTS